MEQAWNTVLEAFKRYTGNSWQIALLIPALIYLLATARRKKEHLILVILSLLFAGLYFCPWTADLIMNKFIGRSVYWRMLWVPPWVAIVAYAGASVLQQLRSKGLQAIVLAAMAALLALSGSCIYTQGHFERADNWYKLPAPTVSICRLIEEDAEKRGVETVRLLVPNDLLCYIRQYNASFEMPYGRNAFKRENLTHNQEAILSQMSSEGADAETLRHLLWVEGVNYFVWDRTGQTRDDFDRLYTVVGDVKGHRVYYISTEEGSE